jgi:hypothetical protein
MKRIPTIPTTLMTLLLAVALLASCLDTLISEVAVASDEQNHAVGQINAAGHQNRDRASGVISKHQPREKAEAPAGFADF